MPRFVVELIRPAATSPYVPNQPIDPQRPQPAEYPSTPPVEDPQPYKGPVERPPGDPQEDRPMHDPVSPDGDRPRS
jgi:hypothetical protein